MQSLLGGRKSHLSLKDALLHQPPSFAKKRNYDIKAQLGEGTFGKVKLATWHVPPEQVAVAQHGAAADSAAGADADAASSTADTANSAASGGSGTTLDIALKVIPKRKVKGNEASVWAEMDVLKGLDHPNIVCPPPLSLVTRG
jgi:calcium/calmodulin-dependent protein kinase I